jgi:hypothetical protein
MSSWVFIATTSTSNTVLAIRDRGDLNRGRAINSAMPPLWLSGNKRNPAGGRKAIQDMDAHLIPPPLLRCSINVGALKKLKIFKLKIVRPEN